MPKALAWAKSILDQEGLSDWMLKFSPVEGGISEGLTLFDSKTIILHWPIDKPSFALVLHEIAHAKCGQDGHDSMFAHEFHALVSRHMSPTAYALSLREKREGWAGLIEAELVKARAKFPRWQQDAVTPAAVVCEEAGELIRAALQCDYEGGSMEACDKEAVQTAAMCVRFLERK